MSISTARYACDTYMSLPFIELSTTRLYTKYLNNQMQQTVVSMCVMSWDRTEGVPRFYMFGEDSASAYVLRHHMSTVLEFQTKDRQGFGSSDEEFEGQSMLISD